MTAWTYAETGRGKGRTYTCTQLEVAFSLSGRHYPSGSWLVRVDGQPYANAQTNETHAEWARGMVRRAKEKGARDGEADRQQ